MADLNKRISQALRLYERGEREEAMVLACQLIAEFPSDDQAWKLRADLHDKDGEFAQAICDLDQALKLNPHELMYLFRRAFDLLQLGQWDSVVSDCTLGLEIASGPHSGDLPEEEFYRNEGYSEVFRMLRAEALLSLGRKMEAKADLVLLPSDGNMWTNQLRTKREMLRLCE